MKVVDDILYCPRLIPNSKDNDLSAPGIVIASFHTSLDHSKVMKAKSDLRDTPSSDVFIHQDKRLARTNLQVILNAVNRGGSISLRGNRWCKVLIIMATAMGHHKNNSNAPNNSCTNVTAYNI